MGLEGPVGIEADGNWKDRNSVSDQERTSDQRHETGLSSLMVLFCVVLFAYVLSIGPAAWLHEKTTSVRLKVGLETIYAPVAFLIKETPLRPAGEWWVSQWADLPGPK